MEQGILAILIFAIIGLVFMYLPYKAFKQIRDAGTAITEAAQQLNNKKLEEAGSTLNGGADLVLFLLAIIWLVSAVSIIIAMVLSSS